MEKSAILKAIESGFITFDSLWHSAEHCDKTSSAVHSEVLDAVLSAHPEWVDEWGRTFSRGDTLASF